MLSSRWKKSGWLFFWIGLLPMLLSIAIEPLFHTLVRNIEFFSHFYHVDEAISEITSHATTSILRSIFLIGLLILVLSKEKNEDEMILSIRLSSITWGFRISTILFIFINCCFYGITFWGMISYTLFLMFFFVPLRYYYLLRLHSQSDGILNVELNTNFLVNHKWKKWGWFLLIIGISMHVINMFYSLNLEFQMPVPQIKYNSSQLFYYLSFEATNVYLTLTIFFGALGLFWVIFSKERTEDEYYNHIRLFAFSLANILHLIFFISSILLIEVFNPPGFFFALDFPVYLVFTPLFIALITYQFLKYKSNINKELSI